LKLQYFNRDDPHLTSALLDLNYLYPEQSSDP